MTWGDYHSVHSPWTRSWQTRYGIIIVPRDQRSHRHEEHKGYRHHHSYYRDNISILHTTQHFPAHRVVSRGGTVHRLYKCRSSHNQWRCIAEWGSLTGVGGHWEIIIGWEECGPDAARTCSGWVRSPAWSTVVLRYFPRENLSVCVCRVTYRALDTHDKY